MLRIVVILLALSGVASADKLVIGTKPSPPFAMKGTDGEWTGISIELWKRLAADLGDTYEIREYDLPGLLHAIETKEIDVAVASLTVTSEREAKFDFSHPIYSTGLAIAVKPGGGGGLLSSLLTKDLAKLLGFVFGLLAIVGVVAWLVERRKNAAQFPDVASGVWWSAVTMTTVGYGDKAPVTMVGRVIGIVWMFAAIIIISIFTATVTSQLTIERMESSIKGPDDLAHVRVATVAGSTSAGYLDHHGIHYQAVASVLAGEHAVATGEVDAMVYDAPILQYTAKQVAGVMVLPNVFDHQDYALALPDGSPLRESLNRALLKELGSDEWSASIERYIGK
ncbi:MAG: transporter substrate-binding domain-containing protein [Kofleriaceae bacterium]